MAVRSNEELEKKALEAERDAKAKFKAAKRVKVYVPKSANENESELYGCWNGIPVRYKRGEEVEMPEMVLRMFKDCGAL